MGKPQHGNGLAKASPDASHRAAQMLHAFTSALLRWRSEGEGARELNRAESEILDLLVPALTAHEDREPDAWLAEALFHGEWQPGRVFTDRAHADQLAQGWAHRHTRVVPLYRGPNPNAQEHIGSRVYVSGGRQEGKTFAGKSKP